MDLILSSAYIVLNLTLYKFNSTLQYSCHVCWLLYTQHVYKPILPIEQIINRFYNHICVCVRKRARVCV